MTLYDLLQWVIFYSIVGAFIYIPLYSCFLTDTDWGWEHKVVAFFVSYLIPISVLIVIVGVFNGVVAFLDWSRTVVLW